MFNCKISVFLSYSMLVYSISSIYYLIRTRKIGTPFNDSLTNSQLLIKKESVKKRKCVFLFGLLLGIIISFVFRPFHDC